MIYSRFGTVLTLVSKTESEFGKVSVQATTEGSVDLHEYHVGDLTADDGSSEIDAAVAKLPMKVFENKGGRRRKPLF